MTLRLLTKHHLEFLSLRGGHTGSSESILVKLPYCWKSRRCPNEGADKKSRGWQEKELNKLPAVT